MRVAIIGRSEVLFDTAQRLRLAGHEIALIITAREAPEYLKSAEDFAAIARDWGVPFYCTPRIGEVEEAIRAMPRMDIGISFNYVGIVPQSIIDQFPLGILNAHGGDLPRYRGNACQAWAILNGEPHIGLCIHRMVGGELDTGDILAREFLPLTINTKVTEALQWIRQRVPEMYVETLAQLRDNPEHVRQGVLADAGSGFRCYPRRPEDGRIDWARSNIEILRLINASNRPYQGAFCEFEGKRLTVWDAIIAPEENFLAVPGQVTATNELYIEVACGCGKLRLTEVEYEDAIGFPKSLRSVRQRLN